jgi:hypothetical protein
MTTSAWANRNRRTSSAFGAISPEGRWETKGGFKHTPFLQAMFQTGVCFTIEAISRKSKPRSFQEFEIAMNITLDSSTLTD